MPSISTKGKDMPESPIRKLASFAEKAMNAGKHIYHLNIGQPDIQTPGPVLEAVRKHKLDIVGYSSSAGNRSLREKFAAYYSKHCSGIVAEDILVTTGGSEALIFTMNSITDPGDQIIVPEPFYANYYSFSKQAMIHVVPVLSSIDTGFALPPIADFEKLITPKTKAILICNPGNPTGYLYSKEEIEQLTALALRHDIFLISDEVYREFTYTKTKHHSVLCEKALEQHAIVIDSVSKRYSMCGARIGCIVSKNKTVIKTALKFAQARLSPPSFAQIAAEAALGLPETYYNGMVQKFRSRRDVLLEALQKIPNIKVSMPKGAFYCMVELPVRDADAFAQWMLDQFDVDGKTLMVAPASGFYSSVNEGRNQIRIAYVLQEKDLIEATKILKLALEKYPN